MQISFLQFWANFQKFFYNLDSLRIHLYKKYKYFLGQKFFLSENF